MSAILLEKNLTLGAQVALPAMSVASMRKFQLKIKLRVDKVSNADVQRFWQAEAVCAVVKRLL